MLDDKDRIFKNLYGQGDWGLEGARKRGSWDGTKAILEKGRDAIVAEVRPQACAAAAAPASRRREMVVYAEGRRRPAALLVVNADESEPGTCKDARSCGTIRIFSSRAA